MNNEEIILNAWKDKDLPRGEWRESEAFTENDLIQALNLAREDERQKIINERTEEMISRIKKGDYYTEKEFFEELKNQSQQNDVFPSQDGNKRKNNASADTIQDEEVKA